MIERIKEDEDGFLYLHGTLSKWCYHEDGFRDIRGPFRMHRSAPQVRDRAGEQITLRRLREGVEVFSVQMYCRSRCMGDYRLGGLFVKSIDPKSEIGLIVLRHWREWLEFEERRLEDLYQKQKADAGEALVSIQRVPVQDAEKLKLVA